MPLPKFPFLILIRTGLSIVMGLSLITLAGCKKESQSSPEHLTGEQLVERGRKVYMAECIACHSSNPKEKGPIGPEIYGSSFELLKLKIVEGKYPEGYTPKRDTQAMLKLPHVEKELKAIEAFLNN